MLKLGGLSTKTVQALLEGHTQIPPTSMESAFYQPRNAFGQRDNRNVVVDHEKAHLYPPMGAQSLAPIYEAPVSNVPPGVFDIDEANFGNPLLAPEYAQEIVEYLISRQREMGIVDWIERHPQLTTNMRALVVDWICRLHSRLRLCREAFFLGIQLLDRVMGAQMNVSRDYFKVIAITCLYTAAKFEDLYSPNMRKFCSTAGNSFTVAQIANCEELILNTVDWNMSFPTPLTFLRRFVVAGSLSETAKYFSFFIAELACQDYNVGARFTAQEIAAGSVYVANKIFRSDQSPWNETLVHYTQLQEEQLTSVYRAMKISFFSSRPSQPLMAVRRTFSSRDFPELSRYIDHVFPHLAEPRSE